MPAWRLLKRLLMNISRLTQRRCRMPSRTSLARCSKQCFKAKWTHIWDMSPTIMVIKIRITAVMDISTRMLRLLTARYQSMSPETGMHPLNRRQFQNVQEMSAVSRTRCLPCMHEVWVTVILLIRLKIFMASRFLMIPYPTSQTEWLRLWRNGRTGLLRSSIRFSL